MCAGKRRGISFFGTGRGHRAGDFPNGFHVRPTYIMFIIDNRNFENRRLCASLRVLMTDRQRYDRHALGRVQLTGKDMLLSN